jgi:IS30 family transposase
MDNGNEFAQHERVAKALQTKVYFAHPYCALGARSQRKHQRTIAPVFP